jgi:Holliday junction resolvasome RuvABC endonuclease subunit
MKGVIAALDLGTNTGWCAGDSAQEPVCDSVDLDARLSHGGRGCALTDFLGDLIGVARPWLIVYETPLVSGRHKSQQAARLTHGLAMAVEMFCHRAKIRCKEAHIQKTRLAVFGYGHATKEEGFTLAMARGIDPPDTDASDSYVLWLFAVKTHGELQSGVF